MTSGNISRHFPNIQHFAIVLMCVGIFTSGITPFPLTLGTFLFFLPVLFTRKKINEVLQEPALVAILFIWMFMLVSGLYSENTKKWSELLLRKIPLLILPLGFTVWQSSLQKIKSLLYILVGLCSAVALLSLLNLAMNYSQIAEGITHSKPMPIWPSKHGISHIYFSIFQSFSVLVCIYFYAYNAKFHLKHRERTFVLAAGIFNFIALHILSSRTGLVSVYICIAISSVIFLIKEKKYNVLILLFATLIIFPLVGYFAIDTFRKRIDNTATDLYVIKANKDINHRSIAMRLEASENAMAVVKDNIITGTGAGDLDSAISSKYTERNTVLYPENRIMPHNQYLLTWASTGIGGLLALVAVFAILIFSKVNRNDFLFVSTTLLLALSMTAESILERQNGVTFFVLVILLLLQWKKIRSGIFV